MLLLNKMDKLQDHINTEQAEFNKQMLRHADTSNKEVGVIKEHIGVMKNDISTLKETTKKTDDKLWWVLTAVIVLPLVAIVVNYLKK